MQTRKLGTSDLEVTPVCLGTMTWGKQNSEADAHAQLDYARSCGINFIDTAEMYAVPSSAETYGKTESIVGSWLKRQQRDRIVLATKIAGPGRARDWIRNGELRLDRANIRAAIEASLRRLQTDYVDLYQLHWPDRNVPAFGQATFDPARERSTVPIGETLEALAEIVKEGKVRYVGVSNETAWGVMEFCKTAERTGLPRIVSIQNAFNLLNRTFESGLAEICFREEVGLLAYSPLAFGHLSGKYLADPATRGRVTLFGDFAQRYSRANVKPAVAAYVELARRHGMSPASMALAWVYSHRAVTSTIIGATTMEQLRENIAAWGTPLPDEVRAAIDAIHFERFTNPAP